MFAIEQLVTAIKHRFGSQESQKTEESTRIFFKVISVTLCVASGLVAYTCYKRKKFLDKYRELPGPPVSFIFGNCGPIYAQGFQKRHHVICDGFEKYGPIFGTVPPIWYHQKAIIYCCKDLPFWRKHVDSDGVLERAGDDLLDLPWGPEYKRRKRAIQPLLGAKNHMERQIATLDKLIDILTHVWSNRGEDHSFDVMDDCHLFFADAICQTGFGINVGALAQANGIEDKTSDLKFEFDWTTWRNTVENLMIKYQKVRDFGEEYLFLHPNFAKKFRNVERQVLNLFGKIHDRRRELDVLRRDGSKKEENLWTTLSALTDHMKGEMQSLVMAGHEAIANCAAWTLYELAKNQDVQKRIRSKIQKVMADNEEDSPMTYEKILALEDVKKVMFEGLRMHPVAMCIHHVLTRDVEVEGIRMYRGDCIRFTCMKIVRDEKLWDKPFEFNPWRFDGIDHTKYGDVFHPFGGGKRKCVGYKFAELEIVILLTRILQRFHLELDEDKPVWGSFHNTHAPRHSGVHVRAHRIVEKCAT